MADGEFEYQVALSFAGEDRQYAEAVANGLAEHGITVFYDAFEEADLWGRNLYDHLHEIYSRRARYCILFASEHYASKLWTTHERKAAQERAFKEKGGEYILPVRIDRTPIPGLTDTTGYISIRKGTEYIVDALLRKLGISAAKELNDPPSATRQSANSGPQPVQGSVSIIVRPSGNPVPTPGTSETRPESSDHAKSLAPAEPPETPSQSKEQPPEEERNGAGSSERICIGRLTDLKSGFARCSSEALRKWYPFCGKHRYQPIALLLFLLFVTGSIVTIVSQFNSCHASAQVSSYRVERNNVRAEDRQGKVIWTRTFDGPISTHATMDVDGDGKKDVLIGFGRKSPQAGKLVAIKSDGKTLWEFQFGEGCPWKVPPDVRFEVWKVKKGVRNGKTVIVANAQGRPWYPNQIVALDSGGGLIGSFWHVGGVYNLLVKDLDGDGTSEIVGGGLGNCFEDSQNLYSTVLFLHDINSLSGQSPCAPGAQTTRVKWYLRIKALPGGACQRV